LQLTSLPASRNLKSSTETNDSQPPSMRSKTPVKLTDSTPTPTPAPLNKYTPVDGDEIDGKVSQVLLGHPSLVNKLTFRRISAGRYQMGHKKYSMKVLNGFLVLRVGGGFMKFSEWLSKYGEKEGVVVVDSELQKGKTGVHFRNSGFAHTKEMK